MRARVRRRGALGASALSIVLGTFGGVPVASAGGHGRGEAAPVVPVRACRTTAPFELRRGPRIPRTVPIALPTQVAAQAALYTDSHSELSVLGPRGWRCAASLGADGGELLVVAPSRPGSPTLFSPLPSPHRSARRAIVVETDGACVVCVLTQACPYFPHARHLLHAWGYWSAIAARGCRVPHGEVVTARSPTLREVVDPPEVLGNDTPSGGPYTAVGEVGYDPAPRPGGREGGFAVTCTLAHSTHRLCDAALGWVARGWR